MNNKVVQFLLNMLAVAVCSGIVALTVGWFINIFKLATGDNAVGMVTARLAGIVIPVLGGLLGYF